MIPSLDKRGMMHRVRQIAEEVRRYDEGKPLPFDTIKDMILRLGYADERTVCKYFRLLEDLGYIVKNQKAIPLRKRHTFTKRNLISGNISFTEVDHGRYAWSLYLAGPLLPRRSTPLAPPNREVLKLVRERWESMILGLKLVVSFLAEEDAYWPAHTLFCAWDRKPIEGGTWVKDGRLTHLL